MKNLIFAALVLLIGIFGITTGVRKSSVVANDDVPALRQAVAFQDVITLEPNSVYTFTDTTDGTNALGTIYRNITINGNGATFVRNSPNSFRFFNVAPTGVLTITNVRFVNGKSDKAGAIYNSGKLVLTGTKFEFNQANEGGAILNYGNIWLSYGTFYSNTNGAISSTNATATVRSSTFISNQTAIYNITTDGTSLTEIANSTFYSNTDGAVRNYNLGTTFYTHTANLKLYNSTVAANSGYGVLSLSSVYGSVQTEIKNTILASNYPFNCNGIFAARVTNLEYGDNTCAGVLSQTYPFTTNSPLDNGGFNVTLLPLVKDTGTNTICQNSLVAGVDQRGLARSGQCDIGATELDASYNVTTNIDTGDKWQAGSLTQGLTVIPEYGTVKFNQFATQGAVNVSNTLPVVKKGVTLYGSCGNNGPSQTIYGNGLAPGLQLTGQNSLYGLFIRNFGGKELLLLGTGNSLSCTKIANS